MRKNKSGSMAVGTRVRVKPGVNSPDFPEIPFTGWTGTIVELAGKKSPVKYLVEWDAPTVSRMPADYTTKCEEQQLFHKMACLSEEDIEPVST